MDNLHVKDLLTFQVLGRENICLTKIFKLFITHCTIGSLSNSSQLHARNILHANRAEFPKIPTPVKMYPMFTKSLHLKRGHSTASFVPDFLHMKMTTSPVFPIDISHLSQQSIWLFILLLKLS